MSEHIAIAEYETLSKAAIGIEVLEKSGFTNNEVTLISIAENHGSLASVTVPESEKELAVGASTGLGMLIGGTVAAPIAMGTMIGPLMVAGSLVGLVLGAGLGGLFEVSPPKSWKEKAADYESRVQAGSVLIVVDANSRVRLDDAVNPLKTTGPVSLERFETE